MSGVAPPARDVPEGSPAGTITYVEKTAGRRREFTLTGDSIRVQVTGLTSNHVDAILPLAMIQPRRLTVRRRQAPAWQGLALLAAACVLGTYARTPAPDIPKPLLWILTGFTAASGAAILAFLSRRIEYAMFQSDAGVAVLDMGRVGPSAAEFEPFVEAVIERTHAARSS